MEHYKAVSFFSAAFHIMNPILEVKGQRDNTFSVEAILQKVIPLTYFLTFCFSLGRFIMLIRRSVNEDSRIQRRFYCPV